MASLDLAEFRQDNTGVSSLSKSSSLSVAQPRTWAASGYVITYVAILPIIAFENYSPT